MKELIERILGYLPRYLSDCGALLGGPKTFIAEQLALKRNVYVAMSLQTSDGSRRIIGNAEKMKGLVAISTKIGDLAAEVVKESAAQLRQIQPAQDQIAEALRRSYVPLAS